MQHHFSTRMARLAVSAATAALMISQPVSAALRGYWTFDTNTASGATFSDQSGNGYSCTNVSGLSGTDVPGVLAGTNSRCLDCTGADRYAYVSTGGAEAVFNHGTAFTIAFWFKGWPDADYEPMVAKNGESGGWQVRKTGSSSSPNFTTRGYGGAGGDMDAGSSNVQASSANWQHIACVYDGQRKTIWLNGVHLRSEQIAGGSGTATGARLTFGARDGNTGAGTPSPEAFSRVKIDDVAFFDNAISAGEIYQLSRGVAANNLYAGQVPWGIGEPLGSPGFWGIREVKTTPLNSPGDVVRLIAAGTGTLVSSTTRSVLNFNDPQAAGAGRVGGDLAFLTNTAAADDNFGYIASGAVRIPSSGWYTFYFAGDDGAHLDVLGANFTAGGSGNGANSHYFGGETVGNGPPTGDTLTYGQTFLNAGDYNVRFAFNEIGGGASSELWAAPGQWSAFDGTAFKLVGDTASGGLQLVDQVPVLQLATSSATVNGGVPANITLSYRSYYATSLTLRASTAPAVNISGVAPGIGSVTIAAPTTTTTYTLTGVRGTQTRTQTVTVLVNAPPVANTFTVSDSTVTPGTPITFNWTSTGGSSWSINQGVGSVTANTNAGTGTGSRTVNAPATPGTYTYTLTVTNGNGTSALNTTVTVGAAPVISSFTLTDANIVPGGTAQLNWITANATTVSISPRVGTVGNSGTYCDNPPATTTYTLTASNGFGTSTATVTVTLPPQLTIAAPGWTVRHVNKSSTLATLADTIALLDNPAANGGSNDYTATGIAVINYSDDPAAGVFPGSILLPSATGNNFNGDNFALKCTATLRVYYGGTYTIAMNNDDGGRLRVDGQDVIVDDSNHGPTTVVGDVTLTAGDHTIEYIMWEQGGGFAAECFWDNGGVNTPLQTGGSAAAPVTTDLIISEFLASNSDGLTDADGQTSDWIEIYNGTATAKSTAGYFLTNINPVPGPAQPSQWALPSVSIPAGGYLVIFASAKNATLAGPQYHTNFKLAAEGGYVALTKSTGPGTYSTVSSFTYTAQKSDASFGVYDSELYQGFMPQPSPGGLNSAGFLGFVGDTSFSVDRGIYSTPQTVVITADNPSAEIRYTTDGSTPAANHGTVYTAPLTISQTTVVRAAAFLKGWYPTNVDTHTYLFPQHVLSQDNARAYALGWPNSAVNGQVFDYPMDQSVVTPNQAAITAALQAIPTFSLVTDVENLTDPVTGIYTHPSGRGVAWERGCSLELLNDKGDLLGNFQIDAGVRIRGGFSRDTNNPKHAFHLFFNNRHEGDLRYQLFGPDGTNQFEQLDIQCSQNYSWAYQGDGNNTFIREVWARDTQRDMGNPHGKSRYCHLFINGLYWGLYMTQERPEANFGSQYLGGNEDDYDVVKSAGNANGYLTEATDGVMTQGTEAAPGSAWARLWWGARSLRTLTTDTQRNAKYFELMGLAADGITPLNPAISPRVLDADNLIDYMLVVFYSGGYDAPLSTFLSNGSNNWFGMRNRLGTGGFNFFNHDNEHSLGTGGESDNRIGPWGGSGANNWGQTQYNTISEYGRSNPQYVHEDLCWSPEYRMRFADRAHRHLFNGGALTRTVARARVDARAAQLQSIMVAESARWGDSKRSPAFTTTDWTNAKNGILSWIDRGSSADATAYQGPGNIWTGDQSGRSARLLEQLKGYTDTGAKPLYPNIKGPVFSQHGGTVSSGFILGISNPNAAGTIYYKVDGTDPRPVGGGAPVGGTPSGTAASLTSSDVVNARVYNSTTGIWSAMTSASFIVGQAASRSNLVISEINYNPGPVAGSTFANGEYEFIELLNISGSPVELAGVMFTTGIDFDFATSAISSIPAGGRVVVVKNLAAFQERYPAVSSTLIAGTYTGSLDNAGEQIVLSRQTGTTTFLTIRDVRYDDELSLSWPKPPDGDGYTLVLNNPSTVPLLADEITYYNTGTNWRSHANVLGNPGGADEQTFAAWAAANGGSTVLNADTDKDGLTDLTEYALGTLPGVSSWPTTMTHIVQPVLVGLDTSDYLVISFPRNLLATGVRYRVQFSTDLQAWVDTPVQISVTHDTGTTETQTWRAPVPATGVRQYMRVKIETM